MRSLVVVLSLIAPLAACSSTKPDPGPSCAAITDNILRVTKQQLTGHGDMELGNRKAMIEQCEQRALTAEQRRCLATATDLTAIAACRGATAPAAPPRP